MLYSHAKLTSRTILHRFLVVTTLTKIHRLNSMVIYVEWILTKIICNAKSKCTLRYHSLCLAWYSAVLTVIGKRFEWNNWLNVAVAVLFGMVSQNLNQNYPMMLVSPVLMYATTNWCQICCNFGNDNKPIDYACIHQYRKLENIWYLMVFNTFSPPNVGVHIVAPQTIQRSQDTKRCNCVSHFLKSLSFSSGLPWTHQ